MADKTRPEDLPAGRRRLNRIVLSPLVYYRTEEEALRAWEKIARRKFDYTLERVSSVAKVTVRGVVGTSPMKLYLSAILHPACEHWQRPMQDEGIEVVRGTALENWEVQPPRTLEELATMVKGHGGRWWP